VKIQKMQKDEKHFSEVRKVEGDKGRAYYHHEKKRQMLNFYVSKG
jgi:hypothetical protein